jgi:hypothetical protein
MLMLSNYYYYYYCVLYYDADYLNSKLQHSSSTTPKTHVPPEATSN